MDTKILRSKILDLAFSGKLPTGNLAEESTAAIIKSTNSKAVISTGKDLPTNWCVIHIGDAAKYINGRAFKPIEWETSGRPIIRIQNLNDADAPCNYSTQEYEAKYLVKKGDLLFAWAASLGTYIWSGPEAWLNQHIFKVEPYEYVDKLYLHYYLEHMIIEFYKLAHGSGMVHITKDKFDGSLLNLPPLAEQKRIVAKVEELLAEVDKIEQAQKDIADTATILQSKVLDLAIRGKLVPQDSADGSALDLLAQIGKERGCVIRPLTEDVPFDIPENWCWVRISDVAESILYGVSESAKSEGKYKLLRITDIQDNQVNWNTVPLTDFEEKKVGKYLLKKGDIVFARTGATVGKSFLIDKEVVNAIYASYLIRVRLFNLCDEHYIIDFFNSPEYWSQITMNSVGVGQPNCNGTALGNLRFPLPPLAEQKRIVAKVEELLADINKLK